MILIVVGVVLVGMFWSKYPHLFLPSLVTWMDAQWGLFGLMIDIIKRFQLPEVLQPIFRSSGVGYAIAVVILSTLILWAKRPHLIIPSMLAFLDPQVGLLGIVIDLVRKYELPIVAGLSAIMLSTGVFWTGYAKLVLPALISLLDTQMGLLLIVSDALRKS